MKYPIASAIAGLVSVALLVVSYALVTTSTEEAWYHLSRSSAQYFLVIPFLLTYLALPLLRSQVPASLIGGGALLALALSQLNFDSSDSVSVRMAVWERDELEADTRVFREQLNSYLAHIGDYEVQRLYMQINSSEAAQAYLADHPNVQGLIWGDQEWQNVYFQYAAPLTIGSIAVAPLSAGKAMLKIVQSVPAIGLSIEPRQATQHFLSFITAAKLGSASSDEEDLLRNAGALATRWSSYAHRAWPWWRLGNLYLQRALKGEQVELGELDCAKRAYAFAASMLQPNDNPELRAAIFNNYAVTLLVTPKSKQKRKHRLKSKQHFSKAIATRLEVDRFGVAATAARRVARYNLRILMSGLRAEKAKIKSRKVSKKKKRRRGARRKGARKE